VGLMVMWWSQPRLWSRQFDAVIVISRSSMGIDTEQGQSHNEIDDDEESID
jgi:hypothetical protein